MFCLAALWACSALDEEGSDAASADYVELWYGRSVRVPLMVKGTVWSVKSSDETVATASVVGDSLEIRTLGAGYSLVSVVERGTSVHSNIAVYSRDLTYARWFELESDKHRCRVVVEAADEEAAAALQQELLDKYRGYLSGKRVYRFGPDGTLAIAEPGPDFIGGRYLFDGSLLAMIYDGQTESMEVNVLSTHVLEMSQDLTGEYRARYPEAGIERVSVVRYFARMLED